MDAVDLDSFRIQETFRGALDLAQQDGEIATGANGGLAHQGHALDFLSNIIALLNETYGLALTDDDKVDIELIKIKLESDDDLRDVLTGANTLDAMRYKFAQVFDELILEFVFKKLELYKKLTAPATNALFKQKWFEALYRKYREQHQ